MTRKIATLLLVLFIVVVGSREVSRRQKSPPEAMVSKDQTSASVTSSFSDGVNRQRFTVVRVIDGDTVKLQTGDTLRYIGIDAPETKHPKKPVEAYGKEASAFNQKLVSGQDIQVEFDVQQRDKYGRLLGYVFLPDGTFVNAELVKQGYAKVVTYPPNVRYSNLFRKLQAEAVKHERGLWKQQKP